MFGDMPHWHDMKDWVPGFPFEVARPEIVSRLFLDRGLHLCELTPCTVRYGSNEFVSMRRDSAPCAD